MSTPTLGSRSTRALLGIMSALAWVLVLISGASADQDPPGCQGSGASVALFVFFADGTTDATGQTLTECESVVYQAQLCHRGQEMGVTVCNIEGGSLSITTPDGVTHDATPPGGVPLLEFDTVTGEPECVFSEKVPYQIDPVNDPPMANVTFDYTDGTSHTGVPDTDVSASTGIGNNIAPCPDPTECMNSFCDPTATDGVHTGLCVDDFVPDSTPCTDTGNECTTAGCDGAGNCDQDHIIVPDSTPCTDTDMDDCTTAGCNAVGMCDQLHVTIPDCNPFCNPSRIRFDQVSNLNRSGDLDTFYLRIGYNFQSAAYNPTTDGLKVTLSNLNGTIWSGTLLPGDVIKKGRAWRYRDRNGVRDGIQSVTTSPRKDGLWRLSLSVIGDFSAATLPEMTVTLEALGTSVSKPATWHQIPEGWQVFFSRPR